MKNEFYIMGTTEEGILYGLAYNMKRYVRWMHNIELNDSVVHKTVAGETFMMELKDFLSKEKQNIDNGVYKGQTEERRQEAIEIVASYI